MTTEQEEWFALTQGPYEYDLLGRITCIILHPTLGAIPFTADPADPEPSGRAIHDAILASGTAVAPAGA